MNWMDILRVGGQTGRALGGDAGPAVAQGYQMAQQGWNGGAPLPTGGNFGRPGQAMAGAGGYRMVDGVPSYTPSFHEMQQLPPAQPGRSTVPAAQGLFGPGSWHSKGQQNGRGRPMSQQEWQMLMGPQGGWSPY